MHRDPRRRWNWESAVEQEKPNGVWDRALDWVTSRSQGSPKWEVTIVVGGKIGLVHLLQHFHYQ